MKKLLNFVLVAVMAVCLATNVYAEGGEARREIAFDDYATLADLWAAIPSLGIREGSYYTTASYTNYTNYYNLVYTTINDNTVDEATRLAYKNHLINAINGLEQVADYSGLKAAIERYQTYYESNEDLYQPVLVQYARDAYNYAWGRVNDDLARTEENQTLINKATERLNKAMNDLAIIQESAANETAKEMYQYREIEKDRDSYEEKSFNDYSDAYYAVDRIIKKAYETSTDANDGQANFIDPHWSITDEINDRQLSVTLKSWRERLVRIGNTNVVVSGSTYDPTLPPIPNTADTVVSYLIMMVIGMIGLTVLSKKLASSK